MDYQEALSKACGLAELHQKEHIVFYDEDNQIYRIALFELVFDAKFREILGRIDYKAMTICEIDGSSEIVIL